jgi:hypothetical protein
MLASYSRSAAKLAERAQAGKSATPLLKNLKPLVHQYFGDFQYDF